MRDDKYEPDWDDPDRAVTDYERGYNDGWSDGTKAERERRKSEDLAKKKGEKK